MREILFRCKRLCLDEWVEGYFVRAKMRRYDKELCEYISVPHPEAEGMPSDNFLVDPDTVGQFTGLTDKNGKKIFEGDIIQYSIEEDQAVFVGAVKFGEFNPDGGALLNTNVGFYVELVDQEGKRTYMRKDIGFWVKFRGIEVIGNIHDNPELMEMKADVG